MAQLKLILLLLTGLNVISSIQATNRKTAAELQGRFNGSLELVCSYKESDTNDQSFHWFRDTTKLVREIKGYSLEESSKKSTLTIENLHLNDENVVYWYGDVDQAGVEKRLCEFKEIRVLPQIVTDRSDEKLSPERITIRRENGESIRFTCRLTTVADSSLIPKWEFGVESEHFHELPNEIVVQDNDLIINKVGKHHRGYYQCSFANRNGTSKVLLRMKDRFAAWWPFFIIVAVVIICVIIILGIEKRQKAAQKAAAAAEEKTIDPLVCQTTKTDVDEKKTSYVNV